MDGIDTMIDPHNEVRKLQELVKKLERQNEVLRSKQDSDSVIDLDYGRKQNGDVEQVNRNNNINLDDLQDDNDIQVGNRGSITLEDFDLIDVCESTVEEEDDAWLYVSPKTQRSGQSMEQLLSWVRQDFDHPSPDVESSRRSLISKLDEVARMKHSSSSPLLGGSRSVAALNKSTGEAIAGTPSRLGLQKKSGLTTPGASRNFDPGTFTRPKKPSNGTPPYYGEGDQQQDIPAAPNAEDIENLAKQQEESLRQSITAPSSRKGYRSKHPLVEGDSARLSPSRFDADSSYMVRHRGSLGSDHSTPPDSPQYNQQFQLNNSNEGRGLRRGAPPINNLQYTQSHTSSDSSLERHSVNSDDLEPATRGSNSRLQQTNYRSSPVSSKLGGLGVGGQPRGPSPQRATGLPTPRRQIARPTTGGVRSSLPTFRRSNIPSPRPMAQEQEENWRDGCF